MACSLFPWCWHERKKQCHCWIISLILKESLTFDFDFDFDFLNHCTQGAQGRDNMVSKPPSERAQGISQRGDLSCRANISISGPSNAPQMQNPHVNPTHTPPLTIRTLTLTRPQSPSKPIACKTSNTRNNGSALRATYRTPTNTDQASRLDQIALGQHAFISPRAAQPSRTRVCTVRDGHGRSYTIS